MTIDPNNNPTPSILTKLDPRIRIAGVFIFILILVLTSITNLYAFIGYILITGVFMYLTQAPAMYYLKRLALAVPILLLVTFSAFFYPENGVLIFLNAFSKGLIAISALSALSACTPFREITSTLQGIGIPSVFVMTLELAHRYIYVLVNEVARMKRARDSRLFGGKWIWHSKVIGQMIGVLFLRTLERAERVHGAMLSRGWDGTSNKNSPDSLRAVEYAGLMGFTLALACLAIIPIIPWR